MWGTHGDHHADITEPRLLQSLVGKNITRVAVGIAQAAAWTGAMHNVYRGQLAFAPVATARLYGACGDLLTHLIKGPFADPERQRTALVALLALVERTFQVSSKTFVDVPRGGIATLREALVTLAVEAEDPAVAAGAQFCLLQGWARLQVSDADRQRLMNTLNDVIFLRRRPRPSEAEVTQAQQLLKTRWRHLMPVQDRLATLRHLLPSTASLLERPSSRETEGHNFYITVVVDGLMQDGTPERAISGLFQTPVEPWLMVEAMQKLLFADDSAAPGTFSAVDKPAVDVQLIMKTEAAVLFDVLREAITQWVQVSTAALRDRRPIVPCKTLASLALRTQRLLVALQLHAKPVAADPNQEIAGHKLPPPIAAAGSITAVYVSFVLAHATTVFRELVSACSSMKPDEARTTLTEATPQLVDALPLRLVPELVAAIAELIETSPSFAIALQRYAGDSITECLGTLNDLIQAVPALNRALRVDASLLVEEKGGDSQLPVAFGLLCDLSRGMAVILPTCARVLLRSTQTLAPSLQGLASLDDEVEPDTSSAAQNEARPHLPTPPLPLHGVAEGAPSPPGPSSTPLSGGTEGGGRSSDSDEDKNLASWLSNVVFAAGLRDRPLNKDELDPAMASALRGNSDSEHKLVDVLYTVASTRKLTLSLAREHPMWRVLASLLAASLCLRHGAESYKLPEDHLDTVDERHALVLIHGLRHFMQLRQSKGICYEDLQTSVSHICFFLVIYIAGPVEEEEASTTAALETAILELARRHLRSPMPFRQLQTVLARRQAAAEARTTVLHATETFFLLPLVPSLVKEVGVPAATPHRFCCKFRRDDTPFFFAPFFYHLSLSLCLSLSFFLPLSHCPLSRLSSLLPLFLGSSRLFRHQRAGSVLGLVQ